MKNAELKIEGMSCGHCVMSVKKELGKISGVIVKNVEIGRATLAIDETAVSKGVLAKAVSQAGYDLVSIE